MPDLDGETSAIDPMLPRVFRVISTTAETDDVWTIQFEPADGADSISFEPAQIGMVGLPGIGEVPVSFSSAVVGEKLAMTIRAVGAITKAVVSAKPGDLVMMRGPFGVPWPIHRAHGQHLLIVVGGLGMAPLRSLVVAAAGSAHLFRSITLVYGTRDPDEFLFVGDLEWWSANGVNVKLTVDRPDPDWSGSVGLVTALFPDALQEPSDTVAMMCGPDVMLEAAAADLDDAGVPRHQIWVTMERNMKCAIGLCGHCQFGPYFLCKDGPVFCYDRIAHLFAVPEV